MLPAETAVFFHFQTVRIIFLVFHCVIISLLAFCAGERNFYAHNNGTSFILQGQRSAGRLPPFAVFWRCFSDTPDNAPKKDPHR